MIRVILIVLVEVLCLAAADAQENHRFRVESQRVGNSHVLRAFNDEAAPMSVIIELAGDNIASDRSWPVIEVVAPRASLQVARILARDPRLPYTFRHHYQYATGDIRNEPDTQVFYRLPFGIGYRSKVAQSAGGQMTTHTQLGDLFAVDFGMPVDTPIVAARDGTVIAVIDSYTQGGPYPRLRDRANVIKILHADASIGVYAHLAPKSARVLAGQRVRAGDQIGRSGNTGYSTGPHLHFAVQRAAVANRKVTHQAVPVKFYSFNPPVFFEAKQGMVLEADYSHAQPRTITLSGRSAWGASGDRASIE